MLRAIFSFVHPLMNSNSVLIQRTRRLIRRIVKCDYSAVIMGLGFKACVMKASFFVLFICMKEFSTSPV